MAGTKGLEGVEQSLPAFSHPQSILALTADTRSFPLHTTNSYCFGAAKNCFLMRVAGFNTGKTALLKLYETMS